MWAPDPDRHTIVIVGAGFSGTAVAYRLLQAGDWDGRVVLVERSGRFGPGLAYGGTHHKAVLNVPAGNMSLDERRPADFVDFARSRGLDAQSSDFLPRDVYGQYLSDRLNHAARTSALQQGLVRVSGSAVSLRRTTEGNGFVVTIDDGRRILADRVVLAIGHSPPTTPSALAPLEGTTSYVRDPWSTLPSCGAGGRVLVVGSGLSMADVVCELVDRPDAPASIIAVSRHGLLPMLREVSTSSGNPEPFEPPALETSPTLRSLVAATRRAAREAEARGRSWRDVMTALRPRTVRLWAGLSLVERRRFVRHLQSCWDAHRHLLPPQVGRTVHAELRAGRLEVRAARIVSARPRTHGAQVTLRSRGETLLRVDRRGSESSTAPDRPRTPRTAARRSCVACWRQAG